MLFVCLIAAGAVNLLVLCVAYEMLRAPKYRARVEVKKTFKYVKGGKI